MPTTLKDIATAAGVSIRTVTRYLKNEPHISKDRFDRIKEAIGKLGYTPNLLAQGLKTSRKNLLGIILPSLNIPVLTKKLVALQKAADRAGYRTMVGNTEHDDAKEDRFTREFAQFCDGLLFLTNPAEELKASLRTGGTPYVLVDRTAPGEPSVAIDRTTGITEALTTLYESYESYVFVTSDPNKDEFRRRAYDATVSRLKLNKKSSIIIAEADAFKGGYDAGNKIAADTRPLIICYSDRIATGMLKRLSERDITVPSPVGVTGFDDDEYPAWLPVSLSTVSQNTDDLAARSLQLIEAQIKGEKHPVVDAVPTRFIKRESTA